MLKVGKPPRTALSIELSAKMEMFYLALSSKVAPTTRDCQALESTLLRKVASVTKELSFSFY